MGKQKMLVNVHEDETRIALTEDGLLSGLHHQQTSRERTVGNIYKGLVVKVNPAFQAAFVDYGEKRNGFLSISDINPAVFKNAGGERGRPRIQSVVRPGQSVMVQVLKEGMREKGAALTTFIGLPGRYLVYTPNSERSGVSRKIEDVDKRHALRDILHSLLGEDDPGGVIIRTAGIDRPAADLKRDLGALKKEWKAIQERFTGNKKAGLVHQEPGSIVRVLRDYFTEGIEEVWVDSPDAYQEALGYFKAQLPKFQKRLRLYVGDMSIFSAHNIEDQIEALGQSRVPLRSGGGIVIESTEAMVAIDVNSGKSNQESDIEDTALRTNMEAADEVARQLRLRNLGGLIVVDFIDMFQAKNRSKVQQSLIESLKKDKARTTVGSISQFGLLELSRQRIDMEISVGMRSKCPHCGGTGHIPNLNTSANTVLRKIRTLAASGKYTEIHGTLPLELANHLLNSKRESLRDLELEFDIQVSLIGDPMVTPGQPLQLGGGAAGKGGDVEARSGGNGSAAAQDSGDGRRRRRGRGRGRGRDMEETESTSAPMPEAADDDEMEAVDVDDADRESSYGVDGLEEVAAEGPATDDSGRGPRRGRDRDRGGRRGGRDRDRDSMGGDNGRPRKSEAGEIYVSQHRITHPDLPPPPTEGRRRQSPFKAFAATVESGLLFDSQQPGVTDTVPLPPPSEVPAKVGRRVMPEELGLSPEPMDDAEPMEARYEREEIADDMDDDAPDGSGDDTPPEEETGATEELAAEDGVEEEGSQPESNESAPLDLGDGRRRRRRGRGGRGRGRSRREGGEPQGTSAAKGEAGDAPVREDRPEPGNERQPEPEIPEDDDEYMPGNTIDPPSTNRAARAPRGEGRGPRQRQGQGPRQSQSQAPGQGDSQARRRRGGRGRGGRGRRGGGRGGSGGGNTVAAAGGE